VVKAPNRHRGVIGGGIIGLLLIYGVLDYQRTEVWKTPQTLWQDSLEKSPLMPRPHIYMGDNSKILGEHELALQEYRKALEVYPQILSAGDRLVIHNNMGATYLAMGRFVEAIDAYQRALQVDSTYVKARESLEGVLALKDTERDPRAEKLRKLGLNWMIVGDLDKAIAHLKKSLELQNDPQTWMGLGVALERKEDWEGAIRVYEVLRIVGESGRYEEAAEEKIRVLSGRL